MERTIRKMGKIFLWVGTIILASAMSTAAQQVFGLPDLSTLKHITSRPSEHAKDIPGPETTMDYYSDPSGQIVTIYTFRGRKVAFSIHSNSDIQNSYRVFMDMAGKGAFQEINRGVHWEIPSWAR
jgi:hypothetical protein